jgi:hypothetical protein
LNDKRCRPVLVRGGSRIASALAFDVDVSPFKPQAAQVVCPNDDNASVRLYFSYGHRRPVERINADLDGCGWISAEGSGARGSTSQFSADLLTLAPAAWATYLHEPVNTASARAATWHPRPGVRGHLLSRAIQAAFVLGAEHD